MVHDCEDRMTDPTTHVDRVAIDPLSSGPGRLLSRHPTTDDPAIGAQEREGRATYVYISDPHTMADCPFPHSRGGVAYCIGCNQRTVRAVGDPLCWQCASSRTPGLGKRVFMKHFSVDHRFFILDNEDLWIDDFYRDDDGHLHVRVAGPGKTAFTLGYIKSYDETLANGDKPGGTKPLKLGRMDNYDGGWVWLSAEKAERFRLSPGFAKAFPDRDPDTFGVYRLELPNGWLTDVSAEPHESDGVHRLLNDAPLVGREVIT
jgi:hypothetical protein